MGATRCEKRCHGCLSRVVCCQRELETTIKLISKQSLSSCVEANGARREKGGMKADRHIGKVLTRTLNHTHTPRNLPRINISSTHTNTLVLLIEPSVLVIRCRTLMSRAHVSQRNTAHTHHTHIIPLLLLPFCPSGSRCHSACFQSQRERLFLRPRETQKQLY